MEKDSSFHKSPFLWFFVLVCLIFAGWYFYIPSKGGKEAEALAALFTALAFAAMTMSLWLQRQELQDTRKELRKTAKANAKSAELAAVNIRAQYLFFWLQQNEKNYYDKNLRLFEMGYKVIKATDNGMYTLFDIKGGKLLKEENPDQLPGRIPFDFRFIRDFHMTEDELAIITQGFSHLKRNV